MPSFAPARVPVWALRLGLAFVLLNAVSIILGNTKPKFPNVINRDKLRISGPASSLDDQWSFHPLNNTMARESFPECYHPGNERNNQPHLLYPDELPQLPWSDMNLDEPSVCGMNKCFLKSISNQSIGYLVSSDVSSVYRSMRRAGLLEQEIQQSFGCNVLSFPGKPPQMMEMSERLSCLLADRVNQPTRPHPNLIFHPDKTTTLSYQNRNTTVRPVIVQEVRRLHEPYLLIGFSFYKMQHLHNQWPHFAEHYVANHADFCAQFSMEVDRAKRACAAHPNLYMDFQGLVDPQGTFYHIDVDRAFEEWTQEAQTRMIRNFHRGMGIVFNLFCNNKTTRF